MNFEHRFKKPGNNLGGYDIQIVGSGLDINGKVYSLKQVKDVRLIGQQSMIKGILKSENMASAGAFILITYILMYLLLKVVMGSVLQHTSLLALIIAVLIYFFIRPKLVDVVESKGLLGKEYIKVEIIFFNNDVKDGGHYAPIEMHVAEDELDYVYDLKEAIMMGM